MFPVLLFHLAILLFSDCFLQMSLAKLGHLKKFGGLKRKKKKPKKFNLPKKMDELAADLQANLNM